MREQIHLFPNGNVETGTGQPGYRWSPAYSEATGLHSYSIPLTRQHWYDIARREGKQCVFHRDRTEAINALTKPKYAPDLGNPVG